MYRLILLLLFLLCSCGLPIATPTAQPKYSLDTQRTGGARGTLGHVNAEYVDVNDCNKVVGRWAQNMQTVAPSSPAGGIMLLHINNPAIEVANLSAWEFAVVTLDGKEISRTNGKYKSPNMPGRHSFDWTNLAVIEIPVPLGSGLKVLAFDHVTGERWDFTVRPSRVDHIATVVK